MMIMIRALVGGTVIDGTGATIPDAAVIIEGDRIVTVGQSAAISIPPEAERIDVTGRTILPGLHDCHVHCNTAGLPDPMSDLRQTIPFLALQGAANAFRSLRAGFTALRDASARGGADIAVRDAIESGLITGPRMQVSGAGLSITGGHGDVAAGWPPEFAICGYEVVDGTDEARKAARRQLRAGADVLKVAATGGVLSVGDNPLARGMTIEEMAVVVEEGLNVGKITMAHAQGSGGIRNAILAGVKSIEHGCFLTEEIIELMLERDVFYVPTLVAPYYIVTNGIEAGIPAYAVEKATAAHETHLINFRRAYEAGVKIAMGTDAGTPFNFHGENAFELVLMVRSGMPVMDALITATARGAELMGWADRLGTIEPGKLADLLVVDGDPLIDIEVLTRPESIVQVIKDGRPVCGTVLG